MVCGTFFTFTLSVITVVIILGGRKALEPIIRRIGRGRLSQEISTFLASFSAALAGMTYWHSSRPRKRTVDLTLAAFVRAIDVIVQNFWKRRTPVTHVEQILKKEADTIVFAGSCAIIMFAWFYTPERLPKYLLSTSGG
jgi:hypothetical protein